ncbi:MAG: signal peptidase I [Acidimicrobiales bacterium]
MTLTDQEQTRASDEDKPQRHDQHRRALVEWVVVVVVALVAALLIKTFAIQAFYIPSPSMVPTLEPGDRVLVNKLSYDFHSVHIGDIVVFRRPPADTTLGIDDLIKRVVALPGQTIYVNDCRVYVNGKEESQPYLPKGWQNPNSEYCTTWTTDLPNPYKVPAGDFFVMGDNRKDSYDSRYWGPLPANYIVGRAFVRMWPPSRLGFL